MKEVEAYELLWEGRRGDFKKLDEAANFIMNNIQWSLTMEGGKFWQYVYHRLKVMADSESITPQFLIENMADSPMEFVDLLEQVKEAQKALKKF